MTDIIICGKKTDTSFADALLPALALYGGVRYYNGERLASFGVEPVRFLVIDCEKLPAAEMEKGILLFKNSFDSAGQAHIPPKFLCVLEPQNIHAAAMLQGVDMAAVTCGTNQRDTISIAGLQDGSAVISLQRSLMTLDERILEPHDFTVSLQSEIGPHRILVACAVLLLAGVDSSPGYTI